MFKKSFISILALLFGLLPCMSLTAYAASVSYVDGNGTSQTVDATELESTTTSWTDGSWYIVPEGGLTISGRIAVSGTVNLILRDGTELTATLEDNSSAQALTELLKQGNITVDMSDYGNFEKVGNLPQSLPKNDEKITTVPGDIILYQGNKITIYYAENTWDFTKLGHINNITQEELKTLLGDGDVTVSLSIS